MIAIHTKFLNPTNSRGARIKAYTVGFCGSKGFEAVISFPYDCDSVLAHFKAVKELVSKNNLDWNLSNMRYGDSADGKGYSFCFDVSTVESR